MHEVLGMVWKKTIWHFGKVSLGLAFIFKHSKCPDDVTVKRMAVVVQGDMRICESVRINAREGYGFGIPTIFCSGWHHTWVNLKWNNMYFSISLPLKKSYQPATCGNSFTNYCKSVLTFFFLSGSIRMLLLHLNWYITAGIRLLKWIIVSLYLVGKKDGIWHKLQEIK